MNLEYTRPYLYPKQLAAVFSDKRWSLCEASTKSGKTVAAITRLIEWGLAGTSGQNFWWVAPVADQARIAFSRVKQNLTAGTFTARESPLPSITLLTGAVLGFRSADNPDSLYGEDVFGAIVDEASRAKPDAWYAIRSTLTATRGPAVLIGNVKGRKNWFWEFCRRVEAGQEPNGHYAKITWRDAVDAGVLDLEEIEDARRNLPDAVFRELYEAEASDDAGNPFGLAHIDACVGPLSNQPPAAFGIDLAKSNDWLVVIGLDATGRTCHFSRWQGIPWRASIRRIHEIIGEDTPTLVDSTGVGDPVLEELQVEHGNVFGFNFSNASKQRIMEGLAVGIQSHELRFPEGPIRSELQTFEYERRGGRWFYSAPDGYTDDCVCALALAREQLVASVPGANVSTYYQAEARRLTADASRDSERRLETLEMMPWRATSASEVLDNELTELYEATLRESGALGRETVCTRCGKPVDGFSRVTDGVLVWHPRCISGRLAA